MGCPRHFGRTCVLPMVRVKEAGTNAPSFREGPRLLLFLLLLLISLLPLLLSPLSHVAEFISWFLKYLNYSLKSYISFKKLLKYIKLQWSMSDLRKQLSHGRVYLCWGMRGELICMVSSKKFSIYLRIVVRKLDSLLPVGNFSGGIKALWVKSWETEDFWLREGFPALFKSCSDITYLFAVEKHTVICGNWKYCTEYKWFL